ncbi:MAG: tetratricopeptide repeat protein [Bacteroidetes bacterium]|nr:tetratricopeptide repeat protein [Bacteroidota bacterium]
MPAERILELQAMLAEAPGDPFLRQAIAMEKKRSGELESAAAILENLLREDPKHLACYYQLALVLAGLGRTADAAETCRAGALQCLVTGDGKARAELFALKRALQQA